MRAQRRQRVEQSVEGRVHTRHRPRDRWRERDAAGFDAPVREQRANPAQGHAAHVAVARIVDGEVVPQHAAARSHPAPHRGGEALLKRIVEQR